MLHAMAHLRSVVFALLLFVFVLDMGIPLFGQQVGAGGKATAAAAPNRQPSTRILFTGKLFGYLRMPEDQSAVAPPEQQVCPVSSVQNSNSQNFLDAVDLQRKGKPNTLLVGMGDNFSPELFARVFRPAPNAELYSKDLYEWDWMQIHPLSHATDPKDRQGVWRLTNEITGAVRAALDAGRGFIPVDNVGCFLAAAHYDAIVPGKHDFYFGPERLRHLARFLATPDINRHHAVQMLAANLVIRTDYTRTTKMLTEAERDVVYATFDKELEPVNLSDGKHILPWVQKFRFKATTQIAGVTACLYYTVPGDPSMLQKPCAHPLTTSWVSELVEEKPVPQLFLDLAVNNPGLPEPGASYAVCIVRPLQAISGGKAPPKPSQDYCVRFTVDYPFFLYPNARPTPAASGQPYNDPAAYVWKCLTNSLGESAPKSETDQGRCPEGFTAVAIFGVVDINMKEHIGQLNDAWWNESGEKFKTEIEVMDPVEALTQTLQLLKTEHGNFRGIKVLLAQMSPPRARQLAAEFAGEFNVVIAEPQIEQVTPDEEVKMTATEEKHPPTIVVVPPPYYDPKRHRAALQVRRLEVERLSNLQWSFTLDGKAPSQSENTEVVARQVWFQHAIYTALNRITPRLNIPPLPQEPTEFQKPFQDFVLQAMKRNANADVALLQKRDFFLEATMTAAEAASSNLRLGLDRILWKGDFLLKLTVKGSALKAAFKNSKAFEKEDKSPLTAEMEKGRGLVMLGLHYDGEREEFLINGEPLDDSRLYTVATSDYVGLGDTGYPELVSAAVGGPAHPRDFQYLCPLRYVVDHAQQSPSGHYDDPHCGEVLQANFYFDRQSATPPDTRVRTYEDRLKRWMHLVRDKGSDPWRKMLPPERRSQERNVWFVSLEKGTASLSAVRNNVNEATRQTEFTGVTLPQVQAKKSSNIKFESKAHTGLSARWMEWFIGYELTHARTGTAQKSAPALLNFVDNRLIEEAGLFFHLPRTNKKYPRFGPEVTLRDETQLFAPLENFTLSNATKDNLSIQHQRTHTVLLPRLGLRLQDRESNFHFGYERARVDRIDAYIFRDPNGSVTTCSVNPQVPTSVSDCVAANSSGSSPAITSKATAEISSNAVRRNGFYFTGKLVVPSYTKVSFVSEHDFELFLPRRDDLPNMTYWRYLWTNSIRFKIFENFSASPKVEIFYFQNQAGSNPANQHFFRQLKYSIDLNYGFDWFSGNPGRALHYQKPAAK